MNKDYLKLSDFNHDIYKGYVDLEAMTDLELEDHYLTYGINEGRMASNIKSSADFINQIKEKGKILEIGPLDKPKFDHTSPDYYSLDIFTKEQLLNNYLNDPNVKSENIVEPSYVVSDNDYSKIDQQFKFVFSSHSIEHMPCVITFLNNLTTLISDKGMIYLIIPDKRYCFDHFKRESDIYDVLQSFYEKNTRPKLTSVLKQFNLSTHNDCVAHWKNEHGTIKSDADSLENYHHILKEYNTGKYIDSHVSYFTPESFIHIIELLNNLKLINLSIHKIYPTLYGSNEFYVIMKKVN